MATRASKKNSLEGGAFDLGALGLGDNFVLANDYDAATVDDWIPTGSPALDAALGGGLPMSRITEVFSPANVGKTTWVIQLNRMGNELGVPVIWADVEGTNDKDHLADMGVNMSMTAMYQPKDDALTALSIEAIGQNIEDAMLKLHEQGQSAIFVIDSVGQAISKTTMAGDYDIKQPGIQAKAWSLLMYRLQPLVTKTNSALILINQVRDKIGGMGFGDTTETPGGKSLKHATSLRIKIDKVGQKTLAGEEFGHLVQFKLVKSKLSQPRVKVKNLWLFGTFGFHESINLLLDATEQKVIRSASGGSKGKYYKIPDPETGEIVELYEKKLPEMIESGEIDEYRPLFAWIENELSALYFPKGHPALKNVHFKLENSSLFNRIKVPEKEPETEIKEDEESKPLATNDAE